MLLLADCLCGVKIRNILIQLSELVLLDFAGQIKSFYVSLTGDGDAQLLLELVSDSCHFLQLSQLAADSWRPRPPSDLEEQAGRQGQSWWYCGSDAAK